MTSQDYAPIIQAVVAGIISGLITDEGINRTKAIPANTVIQLVGKFLRGRIRW
jgi:hypothetical protein